MPEQSIVKAILDGAAQYKEAAGEYPAEVHMTQNMLDRLREEIYRNVGGAPSEMIRDQMIHDMHICVVDPIEGAATNLSFDMDEGR